MHPQSPSRVCCIQSPVPHMPSHVKSSYLVWTGLARSASFDLCSVYTDKLFPTISQVTNKLKPSSSCSVRLREYYLSMQQARNYQENMQYVNILHVLYQPQCNKMSEIEPLDLCASGTMVATPNHVNLLCAFFCLLSLDFLSHIFVFASQFS